MGINYEHLHLIDNFYAPESGRGEKIRVTRDEKTGEVLATVRKIRLADLNIYSPKRAADWRISVNLEVPSTFSRRVPEFFDAPACAGTHAFQTCSSWTTR